jgi:hypothetical protein
LAPSPVYPLSRPFTSQVGASRALERGVAGLAAECTDAEVRRELVFVERKLAHLRARRRANGLHIIVEPGMAIRPSASWKLATMRASAVAGFTTAPPYIPECRSPLGPGHVHLQVREAAQRAQPMLGMPGPNMPSRR